MNEPNQARAFWNKADTRQVGRMVVGGLFVGVVMRWLVISAPPLPVTATEFGHPDGISSTNSLSPPRTADASPSVPD